MRKPMFALLALAISLFGTQCWAQSCTNVEVPEKNCFTFTQSMTTFTYTFGDGSSLIVHFDIVLRPFDLRVGESHPTDSTFICDGPCPNPIVLDPDVFPPGTVCVRYPTNPQGVCDQYDFTGNAGGPHGVPVRNTDYRHLITLELSYFTSTSQKIHNPAFGHAPGESTTFTEDILTGYFTPSLSGDPVMIGDTPGLSSVVALDEPGESDTFCFVSPTEGQTFTVGQEIEVAFQLSSDGNGACPITGTPIRDKTARLSLSTIDPTTNKRVFPRLRNKEQENKFHFDREDGVNELDLSTKGLAPNRTYTITVFSKKFSPPQSVDIYLIPGTDTDDPD
jgi:hypothetical protein